MRRNGARSRMTSLPAMSRLTPRGVFTTLRRRVRPHMLAVLQTAAAALGAWCTALLLLPTDRPTFASIAAVICLGVTHGQRRSRAVELIGGVVLGIAVASVLLFVIGTGPLQIALLVILAMTAALLFRGGELLVNEAAISAILLASLEPTTSGFSADRILEGLIGGGVGLVVASFLLPPDPVAMVGQVAQTVFGKLGRTLEETAAALDAGDPGRAEQALLAARGMDDDVEELEDILSVASETARFSPVRRGGLAVVRRYERTMPQIDFAVRNTRVLARYAARQVRLGEPAPQLGGAVLELSAAVWVLAAQYEHPERDTDLRHLALAAARRAEDVHDREPSLLTTQIVGQVRSVAVDLVRAAESLGGERDAPSWEMPTEELLAVRPA
jgi:uncharacterized membrane protein YgaE (UPF0421/DUF939 family)